MRTLPNLVKDRAGTSALEFAIIAPLFFLILFTLIAYGIYLSVTHAVQQVAADAARTAVAGLNQNERITLVNHYLDDSHFDYAFTDDPSNPEQFTVRIVYDSGDLPIWNLFTFALPSQRIERYSTVRVGGL